MYAVEFTTKISNGKIDVPLQYRSKLNSDVKVILLMPEQQEAVPKSNQEKIAKGFGTLAHLANPDLWEQEEGAWERAVAEKYAIAEIYSMDNVTLENTEIVKCALDEFGRTHLDFVDVLLYAHQKLTGETVATFDKKLNAKLAELNKG